MDKIKKCEQCGRRVVLNGIGSSRNVTQRTLTALLQSVIPFTTKKFRGASDTHDYAVHLGCPSGMDWGQWVAYTDAIFHDNCLRAAKNSNWFGRMYYKSKANELYMCLVYNNGKGYPISPCDSTQK
jgi:hypothetical protein